MAYVKEKEEELELELEYESDPEEAKRSLTMRRRVASDEEEEEEEDHSLSIRADSRAVINSDYESDGQGAPEEYNQDEEEYKNYEEELEEEEYHDFEEERQVELNQGSRSILENEGPRSVVVEQQEVGEEEVKKEKEPFAVPTAGAFYMHDDRFRNNNNNIAPRGAARNRRMFGGRKLWESQNDSKWGHDKFEEMTTHGRHYNEGTRNSRGRYRGRGKNRGGDRGNLRGDKSKVYDTHSQSQVPKVTKGRSSKKYDSLKRNKNEVPSMQYRPKSVKAVENVTHDTSGRAPIVSSDFECGPVSSTKQAFASSLNSASPPFYPSVSSSKETTSIQKRDAPTGNVNRNINSADLVGKISPSQSNATRGKNGVDSVGMDKLYISGSASANAGKLPTGSYMTNSAHPRAQGRGVTSSTQMVFRPVAPHKQITRASTPSHFHAMQRNPFQGGGQSSSPSSVHQSRQFPRGGSQTSSPARAASTLNSVEHAETDSPSESNSFKSALTAKEKGNVQIGGKGSFMYGDSQGMAVSGNIGHGDQNFAAAPAFVPVVPFSGQHPGGMGVPALGMAIPGYVAQPNGLRNPEMKWLPVLAGAAGALGPAYGSPYFALESAYHSRPSGQTSSTVASSKESNANKSSTEWTPLQTPGVTNDEIGQRRRYTQMKFGQ